MTDRDRSILAFVAEHRIVIAGHVQTLLGVSASVTYSRLRVLTSRGLLEHDRVLHGEPGWYQITRPGLAMIGRDLPPPRRDLRCYRHDIGVAWLWLAASRGAFGRVERIVSEREMRSRDGAAAAGSGSDRAMVVSGSAGEAALPADRAAAERGGLAPVDDRPSPFGVPLGGVGPRGQTRLHYPDLLLIGHTGERLAIELELSAKGVRRLETILAGYGADPSIASVLYLAEKPRIRRDVQAAAARLGISDLVHVQPIAWPALAALSKGRERAVARVEITPAADLHAGVPPRAHRHDPREALAR